MCRPDLSMEDDAAVSLAPEAEVAPLDDRFTLLAEADHRIANHLALLLGYVRLRTADADRAPNPPSRESMHLVMEAVGAQIAAIARLHRALVGEAGPGSLDLGEHLHEVCAPFVAGLSGRTEIVEDFAPNCLVEPDQILPLSQIAAEVVTNALKHSREGAAPAAVVVRCRRQEAGILVEIIDNGPGLPSAFDPNTDGGFGFRMVRGLSRQLGGRAIFESTPSGLRFRLTFPQAAHPAEFSPAR